MVKHIINKHRVRLCIRLIDYKLQRVTFKKEITIYKFARHYIYIYIYKKRRTIQLTISLRKKAYFLKSIEQEKKKQCLIISYLKNVKKNCSV